MLTTALEIDGHDVDEADSAPAGLKRLQEVHYNLILSDYAMPGGTGTWMLHEASRLGLLKGTAALIITAHPDVRDLADAEVISKPLDLDVFLEQVRRLLVDGGNGRRPAPGAETTRVEFTLYVSSDSPMSVQAQRNVQRMLSQFSASQVKLTVCDLLRDPLAGEADRIAFTPTLVKTFPEPRMWLVGNLRDPELPGDLLRLCGVDAT
jgi:DNA-binding NtrC family response regulator